MKTLTILTANIAYGFAGMDRFASSLAHQFGIHGWGALTYATRFRLGKRIAELSLHKRQAHVVKHHTFRPVLDMIALVRPDFLVLNEAIYELCSAEIERSLGEIGFTAISWGKSSHYSGTTLSTLVAAKDAAFSIDCFMPQRPRFGGGAGMTGLRLSAMSISVFGVHLTYGSSALFRGQIEYIANVVTRERAFGRSVIIAGDWNERASTIMEIPEFQPVGLAPAASVQLLTCPTFLPRLFQMPFDHVFIPVEWHGLDARVIAFGSDHLALAVTVQPS
jgi:hypothetical protein